MNIQLKLHPLGLSRSQFELLYRYASGAEPKTAQEILERADQHLAETRIAYQSNKLVNVRLATAIRDVIESVIAQWGTIEATPSFWLAGAILYYASSDDIEADLTSPIGFEDDVEVLNACLRFAQLDELCLNPEDYDNL